MNLILEHSADVPYHTDMRAVVAALGIAPEDYDWYISDIDALPTPPAWGHEDRWVDGNSLRQLFDVTQVQFVWAVFSAVPKGYRIEVEQTPFADGNGQVWTAAAIPQLPGALFEIVCWDSSATLLIGLPPPLVANFLRVFPDARSPAPV